MQSKPSQRKPLPRHSQERTPTRQTLMKTFSKAVARLAIAFIRNDAVGKTHHPGPLPIGWGEGEGRKRNRSFFTALWGEGEDFAGQFPHTLLLLAILLLQPLATNGAEPVRVGIIVEHPALSTLADLLTVELS